ASSFAGVTVQSPAAGAAVGSPVHFVASAAPATATAPITAMRIYVDNVSVYLTSTAKIDTSVAMSAASHNVVIQAWYSKGTVYKQSLVLKVGAAAPAPTPTPTPAPSLPAPPANAVTISNIEQMPAW